MKKFKVRPEMDQRRERKQSAKEIRLRDTLKYWGFHRASEEMDIMRERIDLDTAIASWSGYPASMDAYPKIITRKVKIDLDAVPVLPV